jgi:hypothetical protein
VAVQVDEAGDQRLAGQGEGLRGVILHLGSLGGQHVENPAILHDDGMVGQRATAGRGIVGAIGFDGHHPLRQENKVGGGFHGGQHSHCLAAVWQRRAGATTMLKSRALSQ